MIFDDPETAGLEADARVTAMWLWTIAGAMNEPAVSNDTPAGTDSDGDDEERGGVSGATAGFVLEYDAARKIAQGLGARLEELEHAVEVKGDTARLLPVVERATHLFGKIEPATRKNKASKKKQTALFAGFDASETDRGDIGRPNDVATTLDRVHQGMLLFASGRGEALKRFLVEDGIGKQTGFWRLAQALSASGTDEKRWVDGVLARKKGLGF